MEEQIRPEIRLDANESPFNKPDNRYPDAEYEHLVMEWCRMEHIPPRCVYFCCGTEEAVDLSMRIYVRSEGDSVVSVVPTRSIYKRRAQANGCAYIEVSLSESDFSFRIDDLLEKLDEHVKVIYLCSPNSPTGNLLPVDQIELLLDLFDGMVVVDESYVDFAPHGTVLRLLGKHKNLIILRSFSHAWAIAGARLAAIVAYPEVIDRFSKMGLTHPLSLPVMRLAEQMFSRQIEVRRWICHLVDERNKVTLALKNLPDCIKVYPSVANFILVRFSDSKAIYQYLCDEGISVRLVNDCIRVTIGLPAENSAFLGALRRRFMQTDIIK